MYKKFNLELKDDRINYFSNISENDVESYKNKVEKISKELLADFEESLVVTENGTIDGTKTIETWFPNYKADIFLSHSHKDIDLAIKLACWLENNFGVRVFIDSLLWKNIDDLQKEIDKKYTFSEITKTYDYDLRNITTSHVHAMLSTALNDMIDSSECVMFLNTPSSIELSTLKNSTFSPWIYSEIKAANLLRTNIPKRHLESGIEDKFLFHNRDAMNESLKIMYPADLSRFHKIEYSALEGWKLLNGNNRGIESLDLLYMGWGKEY
ncbi:toll/interleukin-1 receptor domain-containing protein [Lactococcus lactis]|uniref:toll/interleukin-1 receptor domain-containing protein n=1 Tax=Lactococcus lactis TaxID=1358 RepID=UPI00288F5CDC|nr:toll/interleukin-1 receptor domain-containing protein [Lactococcus lactis]MDT2893514.1 toll/interleukin-1 receptor domain-containing protein [Lactococcus lactis]